MLRLTRTLPQIDSERQLEVIHVTKSQYKDQFEQVKTTLFDVSNPYLLACICERLNRSVEVPIDPTDQIELGNRFCDSVFPLELQAMLKQFATAICHFCCDGGSKMNRRVENVKDAIRELSSDLALSNQPKLQNGENWKDFQRLFSLPGMMALANDDIKMLIQSIDQEDSGKLKKKMTALSEQRKLDLVELEKSLKEEGYKYSWKTLCAEVIRTKPLITEGILTHWNQPDPFFIHKKLQVASPQGHVLMGTIDQSSKKREVRKFKLEDHTRVLCKRNQVTVTKRLPLMLWNAMVNGSLVHGDVVEITCSESTTAKHFGHIAPGKYVIQSPIVKAGFQVDLIKSKRLEPCYRLIGEYDDVSAQSKRISFLTLYHWNPEKRDYVQQGMKQAVATFNHMHSTRKLISEVLLGVDSTNMDRFVLIKDEPKDDRNALRALEKIEKALNEIKTKFLEPQYLPLLQMLLSDYYAHRSEKNCLQILAKEADPLLEKIKEVTQWYETDLEIKHTQEEILKQLMLEVNYMNFVDNDDNGTISKAIGLLEQAFAHIDRMKGQDLILFMGNTGSGKSTAIAYFLEAKLEEFSNRVGEKVVRVQGDDAGYPKIGQALGTSETLYTQGYRHDHNKPMFCDCPGFNDTRGGDYALCANLSIDKVISGANRIPAIVVVIPAASITMDKGNPVLDLISLVQERFPSTFDLDHLENNKRVFILFSKGNQVKNEMESRLKDGTRFRMLMEEADRQIEEKLAKGDAPDKFEVLQIAERRRIWEILLHMLENQQIDFIDVDNEFYRGMLIEKYSETRGTINKEQYVPAMSGEYMQRKFGNIVKMAAFSWCDLILGAYFVKIPEETEDKKRALSEKEITIQNLMSEREGRLNQAKFYQEQINCHNQDIQDLEAYDANPNDEHIRQQLLKQVFQHSNRSLEIAEDVLKIVETHIEKKNNEIQVVNTKIQEFDEAIANLERAIFESTNRLVQLQTGDYVEVLDESRWQIKKVTFISRQLPSIAGAAAAAAAIPALYTSIKTIVDGIIPVAFSVARNAAVVHTVVVHTAISVAALNAAFAVGYGGSKAVSDVAVAAVEDFIDAHADLADLPRSLTGNEFMLEQSNALPGPYFVKIDGLRYRLLEKYESNSGFKLSCREGVQVLYTEPNAVRFEAEINALTSEIGDLNRRLNDFQLQRDGDGTVDHRGAIGENKNLKSDVVNLEHDKATLEEEIKNIQSTRALEIKELIINTKRMLEHATVEHKKLINTQDLDDKLARLEGEKAELNQSIHDLHLKLNNLEIVMTTQWESAKRLREFAETITATINPHSKVEKPLLNYLKLFIQLFDEKKDIVEAMTKK